MQAGLCPAKLGPCQYYAILNEPNKFGFIVGPPLFPFSTKPNEESHQSPVFGLMYVASEQARGLHPYDGLDWCESKRTEHVMADGHTILQCRASKRLSQPLSLIHI